MRHLQVRDGVRWAQDLDLFDFPFSIFLASGTHAACCKMQPDRHDIFIPCTRLLQNDYGFIITAERVQSPAQVAGIVPGVIGIELYPFLNKCNGRFRLALGIF